MEATGIEMREESRSGVANPEVVDRTSYDPESRTITLHMIEPRSLEAPRTQLMQIQDKALAYLGHVLSGDLERNHPDREWDAVRFQLDCLDPPAGEALEVVDQTARNMSELGIDFRVQVHAL